MKNTVLPLILLLLLSGCAGNVGQHTGADTKIMNVTIGSEKVDCVGVAPMKCFVVDGSYFYEPIAGFQFVEGYEYQLKILRTQVYTEETAPADASLYTYKLLDVISKRKVND